MGFYSDMADTALELLTEFGQQVTFTRVVISSRNANTRIPVIGTPITITGYGVALDYNTRQIDGTIIKVGDIRFILENVTTAPDLDDTVPIDSITYKVMNVKPISPAGIPVIYEVRLRK